MNDALARRLLVGRSVRASRRFLAFALALSAVATVVYTVPTYLERPSPVVAGLLGAVAALALAGAAVQAYHNDGVAVGAAGTLVLLTAVFLAGEAILAVKPVYDDSRALPLYLTFAAAAVGAGALASLAGMAARRVVARVRTR